ncbi:hypothetical protein ACVCIH_09525 [Burkholderia glumae]|uniref:hypothetical protein n=1 Tax=Burkholderia glumae TaxID=337 RepID=UPI0018DF46CE|nr:hypothetical protein [Burkholderia glumae]MCM2493067.1 hypothetical protein [Burkholderia glumae]
MRFVFAVFQLLRVLMMSAHSGARAALDVLRNSGASASNGEPDGKEIGDRTMHFLRAEAAALGISVEQLVHRMFLIFSVEDVELMQASDTDDVLNIDGASPGDVRRQAESLAGFDALPDIARVRIETVAALLACSTATVRRRVSAGTIAAPLSEGGALVWRAGDLRRFLA